MSSIPSPSRVRELLNYDPETGVLTWRVRRSSKAAGDVAGTIREYGYIRISIDNRLYFAHRLAWVITTGVWPDRLVDHRDGDGSNNRWGNLRLATYAQNAANTTNSSSGLTGLKGASANVGTRRFRAKINFAGRQIHLGYFDTPEEAHEAYKAARLARHGEFSRV